MQTLVAPQNPVGQHLEDRRGEVLLILAAQGAILLLVSPHASHFGQHGVQWRPAKLDVLVALLEPRASSSHD